MDLYHDFAGPASAVGKRAGFLILIGLVTQGAEVRSPGQVLTCVAFGHEIFSTSICPLYL